MILLAAHAMGTRFEFVLCGENTAHLRTLGEEALREITLWHDRLSRFEPASDISRLNLSAHHERTTRIDPELFDLLHLCDQLHAHTHGAFDISIGALMQARGLHPPATQPQSTQRKPGPALTLDRSIHTVRLAHGTSIDLGAIAKGFALDRAAAILRDGGITQALLHGGTSSVVALGSAPDSAHGWPITIRSDTEPLHITLCDTALGVSAPRGRSCSPSASTAPITHILNPLTGEPVNHTDTAAIIGPSAAICDAWSTALVVLGSPPHNFPIEYTSHTHNRQVGWRTQPLALAKPRLCLSEI